MSYALCLMTYLMSYDLCLMSHLMSDVICSHGFGLCLAFGTKTCDFVTRTIVSMHCLGSTCHFLRILIPFEEPPHLTVEALSDIYAIEALS